MSTTARVLEPYVILLGVLYGGGGWHSVSAADCNANGIEDVGETVPAPIVFLAPADQEAGERSGVKACDLDLDGAPDFVAANSYDAGLTVFRGKGDGSFHSVNVPSHQTKVLSLAIADFDRDEKPDVASSDESYLYFHPARGDGTFLAPTRLPAGGARQIEVVDLDTDGELDLVLSRQQELSYVRGFGDGAFGRPEVLPAPRPAGTVHVCDLDRDGKQDLLVTDSSASLLHVLLGKGDGTVSGSTAYPTREPPVADRPFSLTAMDFDRDGDLDVITGNEATRSASLLRNDGSGNLSFVRVILMAIAPHAIGSVDLDGDRIPDLLAAGDGEFTAFHGTGESDFAHPAIFPAGWLESLAVADFDRDGRPDAAAGHRTARLVSVYLNRTIGPSAIDCDGNGALDSCDIRDGVHADVDANGVPDACQPDCDRDSIPDSHEVLTAPDSDCDSDGKPDACEIESGEERDRDGNGVPDDCEVDCNFNGRPDSEDTREGISSDCNGDGIPDECESPIHSLDFSSVTAIRVESYPNLLAALDLNGDRVPDLVAANIQSRSFSVLAARGDGSFFASQREPLGDRPRGIVTGDWDADGHVDLAILTAIEIEIFLGTADGTFTPAGSMEPGVDPRGIIAADVNRDGDPDLIASSFLGVHVHRGAEGASFEPLPPLVVGDYPTSLAATDGDRDGAIDLFVVTGGDVRIFEGAGDGSFTPSGVMRIGGIPSSMRAEDLDEDSIVDILVTVSDAIVVLRGQGDLAYDPPISLPVGAGPREIEVVDVDLDGKPDVLTADGEDDVTLLVKQRGLEFDTALHFISGDGPRALEAADWNGDGLTDVVTGNQRTNFLSLLLGAGKEHGFLQGPRRIFVGEGPSGIVPTDLDADGVLDLATSNRASNDVFVRYALGGDRYDEPHILPVGAAPASLIASDLDLDGRLDLAIANSGGGSGSVSLFKGWEGRAFGPEVRVECPREPLSVLAPDMNLDGIPDLVTGNYYSEVVAVLLGRGDLAFDAPLQYPAVDGVSGMTAGDVDQDGNIDVLCTIASSGRVQIFRGSPEGMLSSFQVYDAAGGTSSIILGDWNGDAVADIAAANRSGRSVSRFFGTGQGLFRPAPRLDMVGEPLGLAAADLNTDGVFDFVAGDGMSDSISIAMGRPDGSFRDVARLWTGSPSSEVVAADVDRNGHPDLLVASYRGRDIVILHRGRGAAGTPGCEDRPFRVAEAAGQQEPGDCDQDGSLTISDAICILGVLFLDSSRSFPCGDGTAQDAGNLGLLDWQADARVDMSDAIGLLNYLFLGGARHILEQGGPGCMRILGCPSSPGCR